MKKDKDTFAVHVYDVELTSYQAPVGDVWKHLDRLLQAVGGMSGGSSWRTYDWGPTNNELHKLTHLSRAGNAWHLAFTSARYRPRPNYMDMRDASLSENERPEYYEETAPGFVVVREVASRTRPWERSTVAAVLSQPKKGGISDNEIAEMLNKMTSDVGNTGTGKLHIRLNRRLTDSFEDMLDRLETTKLGRITMSKSRVPPNSPVLHLIKQEEDVMEEIRVEFKVRKGKSAKDFLLKLYRMHQAGKGDIPRLEIEGQAAGRKSLFVLDTDPLYLSGAVKVDLNSRTEQPETMSAFREIEVYLNYEFPES
ncbi:MAG: hypothetical protein NW241_10910 [Bacteroidia bacterium]|nr:hypothetical protein [Bacteroidia bacterium]